MKVSIHAGKRFLERVMNQREYNYFDVNRAMEFLGKLLEDVVPHSYSMVFVLPCFENFRVIYKEGVAIIIIPKGDKFVR